jgi:GNAT superfamily N-acetyltransferase
VTPTQGHKKPDPLIHRYQTYEKQDAVRKEYAFVLPKSPVQVRPVHQCEMKQALMVLLSDSVSDITELNKKVKSFQDLSSRENYDLSRQMVLCHQGKLLYSCLFVKNEGGTAFIFSASPADEKQKGIDFLPYSIQALDRLCQWAFEEGCVLLQLLVEISDKARQNLSERSGFHRLTDLVYLFLLSDVDIPEVLIPQGLHWISYNPDYHDLFKKIILQTYHDSHDCPELEHLRDIEDVLRGHKAGGAFDPRWWKLLMVNNEPAGVLLMIPLRSRDIMELTYMGLRPEYRKQGLGKHLLIEAIRSNRLCGTKCLTLAVDSRNENASQLYRSFGFQDMLRRTVYYRYAGWDNANLNNKISQQF